MDIICLYIALINLYITIYCIENAVKAHLTQSAGVGMHPEMLCIISTTCSDLTQEYSLAQLAINKMVCTSIKYFIKNL